MRGAARTPRRSWYSKQINESRPSAFLVPTSHAEGSFILQTEPSAGTVSSFRIRDSVQKGRSLPWWTQGWNTSLNVGRFSSVCSEAGEILWTAKQYYQNGSTKVCLRSTWICWARHPLPSNMHEKSTTNSFIFPTWKRNGLIVIVDSVFSIANVKHFLQYLSYLRFFPFYRLTVRVSDPL